MRPSWWRASSWLASCSLAVPAVALAQAGEAPAPPAQALAPVVITATRLEAAPFDVPASIDRVGAETIRNDRALVNLSESLGGVPGLLARDRQNYAQDLQISVRGFGARSAFGVRGVRLYVDGIPATLPDGQGQTSNIDLASADRIEVLRGPFSALYGNSSGGVIQVFTEDPAGPPKIAASTSVGSDGLRRIGTLFSGVSGPVGIVASASDFSLDGYREHSQTHRQLANVKIRVKPGADDTLTLIGNSVSLPTAQDPLGLSRAQFEANPRGVDPAALSFNTRKTVDQSQAGLVFEHRIDGASTLRLLGYGGHRNTEQFQSIPVASQASPLNPGGVIALGRDYEGADLRWTWRSALMGGPFSVVGGLAYDGLSEHRRGYQNFVGSTLGVEGALRRDETNDVSNFDQYLQAEWKPSPQWSLNAGLRHSRVRFFSADAYVVGPNGNDSGGARYGATLPVLAALYAPSEQLHFYATAGRGFETPTLNELAYRPGGVPGLNFDLRSATSRNLEVGVKSRLAAIGELTLAVFDTRTAGEIVTLSNVSGRATYQNAGGTHRRGLEAAWSQSWFENLRAQAAFTLLDARYATAFMTCTVAPCAAPNQTVGAGNRLPGTARTSTYAALAWAPPQGLRAGVEARWLSRVYVNDLNADAAAGYGVIGANVGYSIRMGGWEASGFVRGDNLAGRRYAGSVIVNEGNGRFFEPAPGRTWLAGVSATLAF